MIASIDVEAIVAIIGALVAAAVAILNVLKKEKYARTIRSMWAALQEVSEVVDLMKPGLDPINEPRSVKQVPTAHSEDDGDRLREYVHQIIAEYQVGTSIKRQHLDKRGGNHDWNVVFDEVLRR